MGNRLDKKNGTKELESDRIRTQIAIGLIAIYSAIFYLIQNYASYEGNIFNIFLAYIFKGFYITTGVALFLYIILTGLHYKYRNRNYASDFYFPEKFRKFIYDFGIEIMILGFFYSVIFATDEAIQKYLYWPNKTLETIVRLFVGGLAISIVVIFHYFFIDIDRKSK